jgi:WD40 repeat protein
LSESENSLPKRKIKVAVWNRKSGDSIGKTEVVEAAQSSSPTLCKYWIDGNCVHGDKCRDIHSWLSGDRLSAVINFEGHKKLVTGITLPVGTNKLFSGSTDGTVRIWDCYSGQCANVINLGAEVNSLISEGTWIFVGLSNIVKVSTKHSSSYFIPRLDLFHCAVLSFILKHYM